MVVDPKRKTFSRYEDETFRVRGKYVRFRFDDASLLDTFLRFVNGIARKAFYRRSRRRIRARPKQPANGVFDVLLPLEFRLFFPRRTPVSYTKYVHFLLKIRRRFVRTREIYVLPVSQFDSIT